jgi:hypothetical protein
MWTEYAAPNGAEIYFGFGSTNMPRLTALGTARRRKRQPGRARSPAMSQPGGQWQFGVDEWGKFCLRKMVSLTACVCVSEAL